MTHDSAWRGDPLGALPIDIEQVARREEVPSRPILDEPTLRVVDDTPGEEVTADEQPAIIIQLADEPSVAVRTSWLPSPPLLPAAARRLADVVLALIGLVLAAPVLLGLIIAIRLTSPGPALFRHRRIGRYGVMFDCWKLRTMYHGADQSLQRVLASNDQLAREFALKHKLDHDPRVTPLGKWLRLLNLDELPQFWNILRGDMTLIGPRPIVTEEVPRYGAALGTVLSVRPGLTGLWQVSGRSETTYDERVRLDLQYVSNQSLLTDARIVGKTIVHVFHPTENGAR